jgi:predicted site-specific integrase-resolvase
VSLVPLAALDFLYGVPYGTARRWMSEGKLTKHGKKPYQVDTDEVEPLAQAHIEARKALYEESP